MSEFSLLVDGRRYEGWQGLHIHRSMDHFCGAFSASVSERWAGQTTPRPILPGTECQALIDGEPVVTGYIDNASISYSDDAHTINVQGRDRTSALVDCSSLSKEKKDQPLARLAALLAAPFGVDVVDLVGDQTPIAKAGPNPEVSPYSILKRLAALRGVLMMSDGRGRLVITRASKTRIATVLEYGKNILSGSGHFTMEHRFSDYEVVGQIPGNNELYGKDAANRQGRSHDPEVRRYRPKIFRTVHPAADLQAEAEHLMRVRRGRSQKLTYRVAGWRHADGLWAPNTLVHVADTKMGVDADLLIEGVHYSIDNGGEIASLELVLPETYDITAKLVKRPVAHWAM